MKIILAVGGIKPPLTGIGRYIWELASRLPRLAECESVRFFRGGRWVQDPTNLLQSRGVGPETRRALLRNPIAVQAYRMFAPAVSWWRLKRCSDSVFHGPNYYLPPFPGAAVSTVHDLSIFLHPEFHPPERVAFMRREIPIALDRAAVLITDSEFVRREVIQFFGWPEDRVVAVPLGVPEEFRPRTEHNVETLLSRFGLKFRCFSLCVATLEPRKNILGLLKAYRLLPDALRRCYPMVLIGGPGWHNEEILGEIERGSREGWLRYLGYVDERVLPLAFSAARVFVYPSFYEGFGLPVLEAMASGVPVVCSNRASLPEVTGGAALTTDPDDAVMLSAAIERALVDDLWNRQATEASIRRASAFSWDATASKTVEVYRLAQHLFSGTAASPAA